MEPSFSFIGLVAVGLSIFLGIPSSVNLRILRRLARLSHSVDRDPSVPATNSYLDGLDCSLAQRLTVEQTYLQSLSFSPSWAGQHLGGRFVVGFVIEKEDSSWPQNFQDAAKVVSSSDTYPPSPVTSLLQVRLRSCNDH